jgi:hypothetical protein
MLPTIAECVENARQCEWYAGRTKNEEDRKFLLRMAKQGRNSRLRKNAKFSQPVGRRHRPF